MHRNVKLGIAVFIGLASVTGCGNSAKVVDKQQAEKSIAAIQADPHMTPHQKEATIAEIQQQLH